ncbi:hypothetical protein [Bradyrhizobium sp. ORS 86]|uniref:hypothetical protein n=1 Tax=Bradyrhizobium sp. ORS 86 TaxID=1685970 RepID=UPI00388CF1CC
MTDTKERKPDGSGVAIVNGWKLANGLQFLSPEACRDLAHRIDSALAAAREVEIGPGFSPFDPLNR